MQRTNKLVEQVKEEIGPRKKLISNMISGLQYMRLKKWKSIKVNWADSKM